FRAARRDEHRGLVIAARGKQLASYDDEARRVVRLILDLAKQDLEPVDFRRGLAGERRGALLVARAARGFGVARDGDELDARQVLREPRAALRERLRVRADAANGPQIVQLAHQMLMDPQLDLPADLERRGQEHVERVDVDRSLARVLDRRNAEVGRAGLDLVEYLVDRRHRQCVHRVAEVLEHGGLRERAFWPEIGDFERFLWREACRHQLAEQTHHLFVAQRSLIAVDDLAQHLRLALWTIELRRRGEALEHADLFRAARASGDQLLDVGVDLVDRAAQALQRRVAVGLRLGPLPFLSTRRLGLARRRFALAHGLSSGPFRSAALTTR